MGAEEAAQQQKTALQYARAWGENSFTPTLAAMPIFALHARPIQMLPLLFSPALLFASYVNVSGYKKDAAAMSASWSALYMILAMRRKQGVKDKLSARGIIRGGALGLCAMNIIGGSLAYVMNKREREGKDEPAS